MPLSRLSLEDLGLLQLLEKVSGDPGAAMDRFARYGLFQAGLITDGEPPSLTDLGSTRLDELRRARDDEAPLDGTPDPSPA